ncbi:uncharacterized protein LOC131638266 [Vicia villosa]|uniref:uncharacterized protein LOC131638266 n=1 Tax=Vicia villosa TaxID=3911 RepID=UPI00273AE917|nr:uncharacterized protein LOC131638266 [Vicia villosa]
MVKNWGTTLGQIPQVNTGNQNSDDDEYGALWKFQRKNPPIFEGEHEPDKAQAWLKEIEKIFRVMNYTDAQRVQFGTHMLEKELEDLWGNTVRYLKKRRSKCLKFVNGLRHDIKKAIGYQQITHFAELVNKSRIYDEDSRESASHYKASNEGKGKGQYRHCANECNKNLVKCFKCDKLGHKDVDYKVGSSVTCYNCGEKGNISTKCDKLKKEQEKGKVFALSGSETTTDDRLIQVKEDLFLSAKQVDESVQDGAELFMLLATLDVHEKRYMI